MAEELKTKETVNEATSEVAEAKENKKNQVALTADQLAALIEQAKQNQPVAADKKPNIFVRGFNGAKKLVKTHWKGFVAGAATTFAVIGGIVYALVIKPDGSVEQVELGDAEAYDLDDGDYSVSDADAGDIAE